MKRPLFLFVGQSASGKTTIANMLSEDGYSQVWSYTTRPRRYDAEIGHVFLSKEEFDKLTDVVAYTKFNGYEYCATKEQVDNNDFYIIDPDGVDILRNKYDGNKRIVTIYIHASGSERMDRMIARGDGKWQAKERLLNDKKKFPKNFKYDYIVDNESLNPCIEEVWDIVQSELSKDNFVEVKPKLERITKDKYEKIIYVSHKYENEKTNEEIVANRIREWQEMYPTFLFISPIHAFSFCYDNVDYYEGLNYCLFLLDTCCDELWYFGEISKGVGIEIEYCRQNGIPYINMSETN